MELEKQVTSLDISKRLKELGVKQDSLFYWVREGHHFFDSKEIQPREPKLEQVKPPYDFPYESVGSAFTVAELGEMIPMWSCDSWKPAETTNAALKGTWCCDFDEDKKTRQYAETEADARGEMLIYLLENKLTENR